MALNWNPNLKELTAIVLLTFGIILAFIALMMPPPGEIHDSVLYIFAQILIYCGSIFGIDSYVSKKIKSHNRNDERKQEQVERRHQHRSHHSHRHSLSSRLHRRLTGNHSKTCKPQQFHKGSVEAFYVRPVCAYSQVLSRIYEPKFSRTSYGFRPKRGGHDALNSPCAIIRNRRMPNGTYGGVRGR